MNEKAKRYKKYLLESSAYLVLQDLLKNLYYERPKDPLKLIVDVMSDQEWTKLRSTKDKLLRHMAGLLNENAALRLKLMKLDSDDTTAPAVPPLPKEDAPTAAGAAAATVASLSVTRKDAPAGAPSVATDDAGASAVKPVSTTAEATADAASDSSAEQPDNKNKHRTQRGRGAGARSREMGGGEDKSRIETNKNKGISKALVTNIKKIEAMRSMSDESHVPPMRRGEAPMRSNKMISSPRPSHEAIPSRRPMRRSLP